MAEEMLGMPDWWTAFQFDAAVSYFGVWAENRLNEMDYNAKPPRPKYTLDDVLKDTPPQSPLELTGRGVSHNLKGIRRVKH